MVTRLFVYGTLRSGAPMHDLLVPGARLLGIARARGRLYDLGAFPAFVPSKSARDVVRGELFEVTARDPARHLASIDRYEGRLFTREQILVECAAPGPVGATAWVYRFNGDLRRARRILSGDYLADRGIASPPTRDRPTAPRG
jgi:gamma-glutamylcyclotransferase (GGCT)/AIG2-like uncharacterized protein YtfP